MVSVTSFLVLWEVVGAQIDPILFTTPSLIYKAGVEMILSGELWTYLYPSLVVLLYGFTLAVIFGIGIGLLLARYWVLDVALSVYITFLYSIPSVALVPLIVLWAGYEQTAKVIILFMFAFFPMVINTYQGVKAVDPKLVEVGRAFRCNEGQLWTNIVIPASLPFIVTGLAARARPRPDRHGARRPLHRALGRRLSDRAHRRHLSGQPDVRADRRARAAWRHADGAVAAGREIRGAVDQRVG